MQLQLLCGALEMEQEAPPLFDEGLGWMDIWIRGETEIVEEPRALVVLMPDEPETRQRTEKTCQALEMISITSHPHQ